MASKKLCKKCGETKPIDQFPRYRRSGKERWTSPCKSCKADVERRRRIADPNKLVKERTRRLQHKYHISDAEYQQLLNAQNGQCSICGQPETRTFRNKVVPLSVDHDHETGKVRGLLCAKCNTILGRAQDDSNHLFATIQYLDENGVSTRRGIPTVQDIFRSIQSISARIDGTSGRIDSVMVSQQALSGQMISLHTSMDKLEKTTNHRLHEMETDIITLKRPWLFVKSSWRFAAIAAGGASTITALMLRFFI